MGGGVCNHLLETVIIDDISLAIDPIIAAIKHTHPEAYSIKAIQEELGDSNMAAPGIFLNMKKKINSYNG